MEHWSFRLPPHIRAKFAAVKQGREFQPLTLEECRTVVRTLRIAILLEPHREAELGISVKRFVGLARHKRKREREKSNPPPQG
jgi:hypothetical protein